MSKFLRYVLPVALVATSIIVVMVLVTISQGKRPERKEESTRVVRVDAIRAESRSLNLSVNSQGSVRPRTETTLVAEVQGKIVQVSPNFIAGGFFRFI